ncbi:unnamed protein product, partial [Urochloa humidicola]
ARLLLSTLPTPGEPAEPSGRAEVQHERRRAERSGRGVGTTAAGERGCRERRLPAGAMAAAASARPSDLGRRSHSGYHADSESQRPRPACPGSSCNSGCGAKQGPRSRRGVDQAADPWPASAGLA